MKNTLVCGALVLATGGGVAFLVTNRPAPPAVPAPDTLPSLAAATTDPAAPCVKCQTAASAVVDVTDLSVRFAAKSEAAGEFISFDEPPLARPKAEVVRVEHEVPRAADAREVLPPPRRAD